jgi:hypothetical protein
VVCGGRGAAVVAGAAATPSTDVDDPLELPVCDTVIVRFYRYKILGGPATIHKPQTATPTLSPQRFEPFFFNWLPMTACVFELICDFLLLRMPALDLRAFYNNED